MVRSIVRKVMWVGRATVFLVGLTVIFAVVLGVATTAAAHQGFPGLFHLGHDNPVTSLSKMTGSVANGVLQVTNQSTGNTTQDATAITATNNSNGSPTMRASNNKGSPAMELNVGCPSLLQCNRGAPMTVNSAAKVDNLNADLLDGKDSTDFTHREVFVAASSNLDSSDDKEVLAPCPEAGQDVLVGGAEVIGEAGKVVLYRSTLGGTNPDEDDPNAPPAREGWVAEAKEIPGAGSTGNWYLLVEAVCGHWQR